MRLGLLTQWFDPEPGPAALPGVLARGLARRGHDVRVLTGYPNYPSGRLAPGYRMRARELEPARGPDGVRVCRVALYPSHDASPVRRLANYASFGASAVALGGPALRDLDALWVNYSPITVAPAMWRARYLHGVPLVVHVGDLWPDTVWASGFAPTSSPDERRDDETVADRARRTLRAGLATGTRRALDAWCGAMYASAERVTYISPGVHDVLRARGVPAARLDYAPMWADEATFRPADDAVRAAARAWRSRHGLAPDDVVVLYAGALGRAQGLHTLIEAASLAGERLHRASSPSAAGDSGGHGGVRLRVVIAGSGVAEPELRDLARISSASGSAQETVRFVGRVDQSRMPELMAAADACYIGLNDDPLARMTMPSKTQATMAAARPIVVAADGDVARVVVEAGAGWATGSADVPGLARILLRLCESDRAERDARGWAGRSYYERRFAVARAVDRVEQHLADAARRRPQPPRGHLT